MFKLFTLLPLPVEPPSVSGGSPSLRADPDGPSPKSAGNRTSNYKL